MPLDGRPDGVERAAGLPVVQQQPAERGARGDIIRIGFNGCLVELARLTQVPEARGDEAVLVTHRSVVRRDLQRIAKLDPGLLQVARREVVLTLLHVPGCALLGPAAGGEQDGRHARGYHTKSVPGCQGGHKRVSVHSRTTVTTV